MDDDPQAWGKYTTCWRKRKPNIWATTNTVSSEHCILYVLAFQHTLARIIHILNITLYCEWVGGLFWMSIRHSIGPGDFWIGKDESSLAAFHSWNAQPCTWPWWVPWGSFLRLRELPTYRSPVPAGFKTPVQSLHGGKELEEVAFPVPIRAHVKEPFAWSVSGLGKRWAVEFHTWALGLSAQHTDPPQETKPGTIVYAFLKHWHQQ